VKARIDATLAALADCREAMVRAEVLVRNLLYLRDEEPPPSDDWGGPIVPDPALADDPPSREP
jgi:hypothetical protein